MFVRYRVFGPLFLWSLIAMGAMMGANIGYTAATPAEASITYNGTHIINGTGHAENVSVNVSETDQTQYTYGWELPEMGLPTLVPPEIASQALERFTNGMVDAAFVVGIGVADLSASVFYRLQWVPQWILNGVLTVVFVLPYAVVGIVALQRVNMVISHA